MACHITQEKIAKADQGGYYLGTDRRSEYMLSGAHRQWAKKPTMIYLFHYRLAGEVTDIIIQLQCIGLSLDKAQNEVAGAFTVVNTAPGMIFHDALSL